MDPQWQYNHLVIPLSISILITLGLIVLTIRQWHNPVARQFLLFMFCVLILVVTSLLEIMTLNLELSLFFADLSFLGITFLPFTWIGTIMTYIGREQQFRLLLPWFIWIPIMTNIIIWTNPLHNLWRGDSYRDLTTTWFPISVYNYGDWFYVVHLTVGLSATFISIFLLARALFVRDRIYRRQTALILIAFLLPITIEIFHIIGIDPIPHYNSSTLVFPISGLLMGWALRRYKFLDLMPIARDLVVESMNDLMLVLDAQYRIVDINPAARDRLFDGDWSIVGKSLDDLKPDKSNLIAWITGENNQHSEVEIDRDNKGQIYEVVMSPIIHPSGDNVGQLLLLRDITERKKAEKAFYEQIQQVAILEERQRLARELHDSVNQSLFAANTLVDLLPRAIERKPEKVPEYVSNIQQLIHGTTVEMRLVLLELYPDALTQTDLGTIIKHLCDAYTGATGIPVEIDIASQVHLQKDQQIGFYRIAQEALHNVRKHSQATQVHVKLIKNIDIIELTIQDNGLGFDIDNAPADHFGLSNMQERSKNIGAELNIVSKVNQGTSIILRRAYNERQ